MKTKCFIPLCFLSGFRLIERLHHGGSSLREVVAALEADMEAMYEMIDRFGGNVIQNLGNATGSGGNDGGGGNNDDNGGGSSGGNENNRVVSFLHFLFVYYSSFTGGIKDVVIKIA